MQPELTRTLLDDRVRAYREAARAERLAHELHTASRPGLRQLTLALRRVVVRGRVRVTPTEAATTAPSC
jgi:hypothetical protein